MTYNQGLNKRPKTNAVYTPNWLAQQIAEFVGPHPVILDPAIGGGALVEPYRAGGTPCRIQGVDIDPNAKGFDLCDDFFIGDFTTLNDWGFETPQAIIMNPPFNGAGGRRYYPELFLRKCFELFGNDIPVAMITPVGFRANLRSFTSARWQFLTGLNITSIMSLPATAFPGVTLHVEVLFLNMPWMPAHVTPVLPIPANDNNPQVRSAPFPLRPRIVAG